MSENQVVEKVEKQVTGMLEITDKGVGFIRSEQRKFKPVPADPTVSAAIIEERTCGPV